MGTRTSQNDQPNNDSKGSNNRNRRATWRQKLPNVTGASDNTGFAAPVDLFVFNVNKDVSENAIIDHMKASKDLDISECCQVSHPEARTKSFRVRIHAADYEKAMSSETWPYRVRVRPYKHFRQKQQEGGNFGTGSDQSENRGKVRQTETNPKTTN